MGLDINPQYDEQYKQLAVGIVSQALKDYRASLAAYIKAEDFVDKETRKIALDNARYEILKIEKFLRGPWCDTLVDFDMETVIRRVRSMEGIDEYKTFEED